MRLPRHNVWVDLQTKLITKDLGSFKNLPSFDSIGNDDAQNVEHDLLRYNVEDPFNSFRSFCAKNVFLFPLPISIFSLIRCAVYPDSVRQRCPVDYHTWIIWNMATIIRTLLNGGDNAVFPVLAAQ